MAIIFAFSKMLKVKNVNYDVPIIYLIDSRLFIMISYKPFWNTLENSKENWYTLTKNHHISHSTLHRLKHDMAISTKTLNDLCRILHCQVQDIVVYIPSDEDQLL